MNHYLLFRIGGDHYALPLYEVGGVHRSVALTKVPQSLDFIRGVVNNRGKVLPVFDLKNFLYGENTSYYLESELVFCRHSQTHLAIIADQILDLIHLPSSALDKPQEDIPFSKHLMGVGHREEDLILVLNLPSILEDIQLPQREAQLS